MLSPAGLPFVIARVIAQSGGRLSRRRGDGLARVDDALPQARVGRARERRRRRPTSSSNGARWALVSKRLAIRGLGAGQRDDRRQAVDRRDGAAREPRAAARRRHRERRGRRARCGRRARAQGRITGLAFGYAGDADVHRINGAPARQRLRRAAGRRDARRGRAVPAVRHRRDRRRRTARRRQARHDARRHARCDRRRRQGDAARRDAGGARARSRRSPAARSKQRSWHSAASISQRFRDTLPTTRMALDLDVRPAQGGGFAGTFRATNALPGADRRPARCR